MSYLYTGSRSGSSQQTGLSTQILIKIDNQTVGAVQQLRADQRRPLRKIQEIGTDGVIEITPQSATEFSVTVSRIYFDKKNLPMAFNRGFINIQSQRRPFDIFIYDLHGADPENSVAEDGDLAEGATAGILTTIYENCWFSSYNTSYQATDYVIMEDAVIEAEFAHSFRDSPGRSAVQASDIKGNGKYDSIEALADRAHRGSMDARGLSRLSELDLGLSDTDF